MIEYGHLIHRFGHLDGEALLAPMLRDVFPGRLAVVSSFGAESAVLLHMAAGIDRSVPVIFLETGKLFPETLAYRDRLVAHLGLEDVRSVTPDPAALDDRDPERKPACVGPRRLLPHPQGRPARTRARRPARLGHRPQALPRRRPQPSPHPGSRRLAPQDQPARPLVARRPRALHGAHALPPHPLEAQGFTSIGCAPCTRPPGPGGSWRDGRWAGTAPRPNAASTGPTTASPCGQRPRAPRDAATIIRTVMTTSLI
jgi:phosphoadenosine phosphosulfate reductase